MLNGSTDFSSLYSHFLLYFVQVVILLYTHDLAYKMTDCPGLYNSTVCLIRSSFLPAFHAVRVVVLLCGVHFMCAMMQLKHGTSEIFWCETQDHIFHTCYSSCITGVVRILLRPPIVSYNRFYCPVNILHNALRRDMNTHHTHSNVWDTIMQWLNSHNHAYPGH